MIFYHGTTTNTKINKILLPPNETGWLIEDFKGYEDLILKGLLLNNFLIEGADYSEFEEILKVKKELGVELKTL